MRYFTAAVAAALFIESVASTAWLTKSARVRRTNESPASKGFVTSDNGQFQLNGHPFFYVATNVYYLMQLSDANLKATLQDIAKHNISVIRTWGFNDVSEIPQVGAWFQAILPNGTVVNEGANGLQRLDTIVQFAEELGLKVQFVLTNNWNPARPTTGTSLSKRQANTTSGGTASGNITHLPGFLSNDYGGMDAYVRGLGQKNHDAFYTNETLINAFTNFLQVIVSRYKDNTTVLSWEIANDPRCSSTLPESGTCTPQTITKWHALIARFIRSIDPNHLVSSGTQGWMCIDCPKLFPLQPRPQASPAPGQKRRATGPLTGKRMLARRRAKAKRSEEAAKKRWAKAAEKRSKDGKVKWTYRGKKRDMPHTARQTTTQAMGPAFDGSYGVDSQDIINIPDIGFGTFQLFPDQDMYEPGDPTLSAFENVVQDGVDWINLQAEAAVPFGKPLTLTGFGLVTQANLPDFTPFNSSQAFVPLNVDTTQGETPSSALIGVEQGQIPVSDTQQETAYQDWINAAIQASVSGITNWQWSEADLQQQMSPPPSTEQGQMFVPSLQQQTTPNDGYATVSDALKNVFQQGSLQQQLKNV